MERKQLFGEFGCSALMSLLGEVFPSLIRTRTKGLPNWNEEDEPWAILSGDEFGLLSQICKLDLGDDGVAIHPSALISENVKIEGPCFIGKNAEVRHSAYIRKGSWICEGAIVGHCSEVKNSILLPNSKAPHFNYVGDSIIGEGANLGAGVKLSNVRNDKRGVLVTLRDGSRVDSGLRKLGALVGDGVQIGCNVVTNPGAIISPLSKVPPNETVSGWI